MNNIFPWVNNTKLQFGLKQSFMTITETKLKFRRNATFQNWKNKIKHPSKLHIKLIFWRDEMNLFPANWNFAKMPLFALTFRPWWRESVNFEASLQTSHRSVMFEGITIKLIGNYSNYIFVKRYFEKLKTLLKNK